MSSPYARTVHLFRATCSFLKNPTGACALVLPLDVPGGVFSVANISKRIRIDAHQVELHLQFMASLGFLVRCNGDCSSIYMFDAPSFLKTFDAVMAQFPQDKRTETYEALIKLRENVEKNVVKKRKRSKGEEGKKKRKKKMD